MALAASTAFAQKSELPIYQIRVGDQMRSYSLDQPHADRAHARLPIIIYLHGVGTHITDTLEIRYNMPFAKLPGLEAALIVYPQGADRNWDSIPGRIDTWHRLSDINGEQVDDIGFLRALIADLVTHYNGDAARVYVVGVSAGGYMTARVACELGDSVTAVADVIATAHRSQLRDCPNSRPIPFLLLASTTDPVNPYAGRAGDEVSDLASAVETVSFFVQHNGCTSRREEPLPHLDRDVPSTVTLTRYADCAQGADVLFYRVDGSGHSVPSTAPPEPGSWEANGARNRDIETAQVVWSFFQERR
ncbi:alpha/beta hydrolase family esterase [Rhodopila sp.]|uniref:alpha/beta hydrolase family esterase n=1 Tax=Rhodopila sp. TaxID=2480087 RepID=UPI003D0FC7BD